MNLEEEIKHLVAQIGEVPVETVALDVDFITLGIDSLASLTLVAAAEKRFGIKIPEEQLGRIRNIRDILEFAPQVAKKEQAKRRGAFTTG